MKDFLLISLGAMTGANLRYAVSRLAMKQISASFPWGTMLINATGSFILGFFLVWTSERVLADPRWRPLVAVGFCGGYTTFSTFEWETFKLVRDGSWGLALANVLGSVLAGFCGVLLAVLLIVLVFPRR